MWLSHKDSSSDYSEMLYHHAVVLSITRPSLAITLVSNLCNGTSPKFLASTFHCQFSDGSSSPRSASPLTLSSPNGRQAQDVTQTDEMSAKETHRFRNPLELRHGIKSPAMAFGVIFPSTIFHPSLAQSTRAAPLLSGSTSTSVG